MKFWKVAKIVYDGWKIKRQMKKMGFDVPYLAPPHPFFDALENEDSTAEEISALLDEGYDVNEIRKGNGGIEELPLRLAAEHLDTEILKLLLERGADPNISDSHNYTPLHSARTIDNVRLLLDYGAKYPSATSFGETPIRGFSRNCEFDAVELLLAHGGSREELKFSELHDAVAFGAPELRSIIKPRHQDMEVKDALDRTPLALAVELGKLDDARLLVENNASTRTVNHVGSTLLHLAVHSDSPEMIQLVLDFGGDLYCKDQFGYSIVHEAVASQKRIALEYLLNLFEATPYYSEVLGEGLAAAYDREIILLLIDRGGNPSALDSEGRKLLNPAFFSPIKLRVVSQEEFTRARSPRFGKSNPEEIIEPFWQAMITERCYAYNATVHFNYKTDYCGDRDPVWCALRFGQSITHLPDGRVIEIAGEHEDGYDPDFCIYNDVFVHEPGKTVRVFCYPREVFPPTDFHSATLVGDWIYIIGSLGYKEDRGVNICPVYRLNIHSLVIEQLKASGEDPGRIHGHRAWLVSDNEIGVADGSLSAESQKFNAPHAPSVLNINTLTWFKLKV